MPKQKKATIKPTSPQRYKLELPLTAELLAKIERAQALLSHTHRGDLVAVVEAAFDALIRETLKKKFGKTDKPRTSRAPAKAGRVASATRREVHDRDGERCVWVNEKGERCPEVRYLQFEHDEPRAVGGSDEATNIKIYCRAHNLHAAKKFFGKQHVERAIRARQAEATRKREAASRVEQERVGDPRSREVATEARQEMRSAGPKGKIASEQKGSTSKPPRVVRRENKEDSSADSPRERSEDAGDCCSAPG